MANPKSRSRREFLLGGNRPLANEGERSGKLAAGAIIDSDGYLEQYAQNAMACEFEFSFHLRQYPNASSVSATAFELLTRLEDQMTVYRDDSQISKVNQNGFESSVSVSPSLASLLARAIQLSTDTGGAFDVTSGHLSQLWGFERRQGKMPSSDQIKEALETVGSDLVLLDEENHRVSFKQEGVKLNLGGIGKGYALDRVSELFLEAGIGDFLLHGGQSSLVAHGSSEYCPTSANETAIEKGKTATEVERSHSLPQSNDRNAGETAFSPVEATTGDTPPKRQGWKIGITHPSLPNVRLAEVTLVDAAMGTSGTAKQGFYHRGKRYGHIINPKTGWPTGHFLSTTVIAPRAETADALATAFFVMTTDEIDDFCRRFPQVKAILISPVSKSSSHVNVTTMNLDDDEWNVVSA